VASALLAELHWRIVMSIIQLPPREDSVPAPKITAQTLLERKQARQPITALTAYDYSTARLVDQAGIDMVLVGDSLGMAVLGYDSTLPVTMDEMLHHTRAVRRGVRHALLVADMPFGSYHSSTGEAIANATRFIKESGAEAVKIEGGRNRAQLVSTLTQSEIAVVGHIGLTPQSVHRIGYRVQGKSAAAIDGLIADAQALEAAGAIAIVLECIPREAALAIPTIGIGAGPDCDGQILVFHDLVNLTGATPAKFVRRYADASALFTEAIQHYASDVRGGTFPADAESYHLPREAGAELLAREPQKRSRR
jgi:3-methyl-2-oxobutanoate hydroxymethyltransferase